LFSLFLNQFILIKYYKIFSFCKRIQSLIASSYEASKVIDISIIFEKIKNLKTKKDFKMPGTDLIWGPYKKCRRYLEYKNTV
jgi:hypothetical protein